MTMKVTINRAGMRQLATDVVRKVGDADTSFRNRYGGRRVDEIKPHVRSWFARAGLNLQSEQIQQYAVAVANRAPFKWVLR
jgi:hypothetical protein